MALTSEQWLELGNDTLSKRYDLEHNYESIVSKYGRNTPLPKSFYKLKYEFGQLRSLLDGLVNSQYLTPHPSSFDLLPGTDIRLTNVFYGREPSNFMNQTNSIKYVRPYPKCLDIQQRAILDTLFQNLHSYLNTVRAYFPHHSLVTKHMNKIDHELHRTEELFNE
jgi:hypothetical protein